ncbi:Type I secretion target GGXGXDXXX repeat protein domain protein [Hyella patelloides LEGE 07179]|uniref:Type I secretion target GGXGXDXXX repeat protein domain protein n=1 Tax=Hyella patelloides LEGE 07179 TaxID=945734 RepID=A0A563VYF6_9CYAN|nr:FG-GAP repeat protein [Hyella patelloides]VEP16461.1 Type I secretion target GGXGXDXXX repeat protein domain protein [Hyella patelloides LEGE 07179]
MALDGLNLANSDGNSGFVIIGEDRFGNVGSSVSNAGDVNGDGIDDLIIGAPGAGEEVNYSGYYGEYTSSDRRGEAYIIFGRTEGFDVELNVSALDVSNGFQLSGINSDDNLGRSVSNAGDVNGDGIDDLIVSAPFADNPSDSYNSDGEAYIIFGSTEGFDSKLDVSTLDGSNGFIIPGNADGDNLGRSVSSAGDINGDGIDDLIIGAPEAGEEVTSYYGNYTYSDRRGEAYIVFGSTEGFNTELDLSTLNGSNGFQINGINSYDNLGSSVSNAGDINGDGIDDLIIGAPYANDSDDYYSSRGEAYIIFGSTKDFDSELDINALNGSNGFTIPGNGDNDNLGRSVSNAGDINGDGIDDLIIGAPYAGEKVIFDYGFYTNSDRRGEAYIVFGSTEGFDAELDLSTLDGSNGFQISGINSYDNLGRSVSSAGDFNGDGFDDIIISVPYANSSYDYNTEGQVYLLFGNSGSFDANIDLNTLDPNDGLLLSRNNYEGFGNSVSGSGDLNGDSFDDLVIGAPNADTDFSYDGEGKAYVVFGFTPLDITGTVDNDSLTGTIGADSLSGLKGDDTLDGLAGSDTLKGGKGNDRLLGQDGNDLLNGDADNDTLEGGRGEDTLKGGSGNDRLLGQEDDDILRGNAGNDTLQGNSGNDLLNGDTGSDRIFGQYGNDTINGGTGEDTLNGQQGNDTLNGGAGDDILNGGDRADILRGGAGFDYLAGGNGDDELSGADGDDTLIGIETDIRESNFGLGEIDTLTGGAGEDTFVLGDSDTVYYSDADNFSAGESDFAMITDLNTNQDTIQLTGSAELYSLDFFGSEAGTIDAKLIYDPGIETAGELIGVLKNISPELTMDDSVFAFV